MSDLHDLAAAYVLGALEPSEVEAFESHLDGCPACQVEVGKLGEGLAAMANSEAETPPPHVREAVLAGIQQPAPAEAVVMRRQWSWQRIVLPAAAAAVVVLAVSGVFTSNPVEQILAASDAVALELTTTDAYPGQPPAVARVVFSEMEGAAAIDLAGLADAGKDMTYQLWLISSDGPVSAGIFVPDGDGVATVRLDGTPGVGQTVGVTQEPAGGSDAPTGDVLFVVDL